MDTFVQTMTLQDFFYICLIHFIGPASNGTSHIKNQGGDRRIKTLCR